MMSSKDLFNQGVLWFKANQVEIAKTYWEESAKQGNPSAMFCLGIYFLSSRHYDEDKAIFWFRKAEVAGHKNAKVQLYLLANNNNERREIASQYFSRNNKKINLQRMKYPIIKFGNYEWIVIADEGDKEFLLSKYIIDIRPYHNEDVPITWEKSDLRKWLNNSFWHVFPESCRDRILEVTNHNSNNEKYLVNGGIDTKDRCFLLSYDELIKYMGNIICENEGNDILSNDNNNESLVSLVNLSNGTLNELMRRTNLDYSMIDGQQIGWWLRTPGSIENRAMRINCNGAIRLHGREVTGGLVGVRPAMWVKR